MQEVTEESVLGDFDDAEYDHYGVTTRFYRSGGRYMVRTDGPDGAMHDYEVRYVFGVYPLQQYLIPFPDGRLQALDIAWDSRSETQGGQRWMHLHPDESIRHDDPLHWTGPYLNWNYQCADCHSTNLRKNYDAASDSYATTWSEIDVGCEACHGPGSGHVAWAEGAAASDKPAGDAPARTREDDSVEVSKRLVVNFGEREGVAWIIDEKTGRPKRSSPRTSRTEIEVCARCHSRRSQLTDEWMPGDAFMDGYRPALLTEGLYHADGSVLDEVYVYGSFLQSKMYAAGVTCSDCHDPHTLDFAAPVDAVCGRCHEPGRYASVEHHKHPVDSQGARCAECHMPPTTFMQVDVRHDHSFRVPQPALAASLDAPNACNNCHTGESPEWAAARVREWYGREPQGFQMFAPALHAARMQRGDAEGLLREIAANDAQPAIGRATALAELAAFPSRASLEIVRRALASADPMMRLAALQSLQAYPSQIMAVEAFPLLQDPVRGVRIEAARLLAPLPPGQLPEEDRRRLDAAMEEYTETQRFSAERAEARVNLGNLYSDLRRVDEAEQEYFAAMALQPGFIPAYVNLAQLLSSERRETDAEEVLRRGLIGAGENASLYHALGLSLVRQGRADEALAALQAAHDRAPGNLRYGYVYAVALHSGGDVDAALEVLKGLDRRFPMNIDVLLALTTFNRDAGRIGSARLYADRLLHLQPDNPQFQELRESMQ